MSLAAFFSSIVPVLRAEVEPDTLSPGDSTLRLDRVALYVHLVRTDLREALRRGHHAVWCAAELVRPGLWSELADGYLAAHPPCHWDPGRIGAHFAEHLRRKAGPGCPSFLADLADLHTALYRVAVAPDVGLDEALDVSIVVRRYATSSPRFWLDVDRGSVGALPQLAETLTIVYRNFRTERSTVFFPSPASLAALLRACSPASPPAAGALTEPERAARATLVAHGVLPPAEE